MTKVNTTDIIKLNVTNSTNANESAEICGFAPAIAEKLKQIADNGGTGGGTGGGGTSTQQHIIKDFSQELRTAFSLISINTIDTYGIIVETDTCYIVSIYVNCGTDVDGTKTINRIISNQKLSVKKDFAYRIPAFFIIANSNTVLADNEMPIISITQSGGKMQLTYNMELKTDRRLLINGTFIMPKAS